MHSDPRGSVVVGVSDSSHGLTAIEVGASEAILRGIRLHLVHAIEWPDIDLPIGASLNSPVIGKERRRAQLLLFDGLAHAREIDQRLPATSEVVVDATRLALVRASRAATLLVVGRRPGLATFLPDPVGVHLTAHAMSPVIIALAAATSRADVVASIDAAPTAAGVLEFAFREATLRGAGVTVTHAWPEGADPAVEERTATVLADVLPRLRQSYPDVRVQMSAAGGSGRDALAETSLDAQMLVIGGPSDGLAGHIHAASLAHALLRGALCPIAVIPPSQAALT